MEKLRKLILYALFSCTLSCEPEYFGPACERCAGLPEVCAGQGFCDNGCSGSGECRCLLEFSDEDFSQVTVPSSGVQGELYRPPKAGPVSDAARQSVADTACAGGAPALIVDLFLGLAVVTLWCISFHWARREKSSSTRVEKGLAFFFVISSLASPLLHLTDLSGLLPAVSSSTLVNSAGLTLPLIVTAVFSVSLHVHPDLIFVGLIRLRRKVGMCVVGVQVVLVGLSGAALLAAGDNYTRAFVGLATFAIVNMVTCVVGVYGWIHCFDETVDIQSVISFPILLSNLQCSGALMLVLRSEGFFSAASCWGGPLYRLFLVTNSLLIAMVSTPMGSLLEYRVKQADDVSAEEP